MIKIKWLKYPENTPPMNTLCLVKFHYKGPCGEEWQPWGMGIWNGKGFNFHIPGHGRQVAGFAVMLKI